MTSPSDSPETPRPVQGAPLRLAGGLLLLAVIYFVAARLGQIFQVPGAGVVVAWPPSGLVLGVLLVFPRRLWPGILLTVGLANTLANVSIGHPWSVSAAFSLVDILEGLVGAGAVIRVVGHVPRLSRLPDVLALVFLPVIVCNAVTALAGAAVAASVLRAPFWSAWATWAMSNGIGMLLVAPLILAVAQRRVRVPRTGRDAVRMLLLYAAVLATGIWVFARPSLSPSLASLPYLVFPLLLWAGLTLGPFHASATTLGIAFIAGWCTHLGSGPFAILADTGQEALGLQAFLAVASVSALAAAAVVEERRHAEERTAQAQRRFRAVFENVRDGILLIEGDRTVEANIEAERIYGAPPGGMIGRRVEDFSAPVQADGVGAGEALRQRLEAATADRRQYFEWASRRLDGRGFEAEVGLTPVQLDGRDMVIAVVRDMTERHALENQLRQAQKMEAVGRLAGGVAHDFNNLLTVIKGYAELAVLDAEAEGQEAGPLDEIRKAAERASGLTRQLLAFSRKQILQPVLLDPNAIVGEMDRMLRRLIGEDIELLTVVTKGAWPVFADRGQVEQVLLNLALNARDAMPDGGRLTIEAFNAELDAGYASTHADAQPGQYVVLAVTDTGTGMSPEVQAHLFEPFFTTKERGKGTGLGLSTVYGIVRQSGGHVTFYSEPGRGTTFRVYLPAAETERPVEDPGAKRTEVQHGRETVLLVEDDPAVRGLARHLLERWGYRVLVAAGGPEAIAISQAEPEAIHLLLTDVVMPRLGGGEVAAQLTRERPHLKVLFMSGYTQNAIVHHGVLDPGVSLIQKPFSPDGLARKIREVLDGGVAT